MATQTVTAIISPEEVAKLVPPVVSQAQQMTINSPEDYEMAGAFLQLIARRKKQIEEVFNPIVKKAYDAWKEACAQRDKLFAPLEEAKLAVNRKLQVWTTDQDRIRRAEEARLAAEERKRIEAEAIEQASQLERSGEPELAQQVLESAASAPAPVIVLPSAAPKMAEMQKRENWKFDITDETLIPREFLSPDEKKIGAVVRSQKGMARIPGVRVYSETSFHGRTA